MTGENRCAVDIEGLHYHVNQHEILKGINLQIKQGEFVGIIGPNGAGKTTLLKCINGINRLSSGCIRINGRELKELNDRRTAREVALMHQNTSLSFSFPCLDVVLMGRYPYLGRMKSETREDYGIARDNMRYTDTLQFEKRAVDSLSGGERQRVLFAKVLTQDTGIILLDEPTASLDITHQEQIFQYAYELYQKGRTVIAAVHDLKVAARYCSRLVLMQEGQVLAEGTPEKVLTSENLSLAYGVNALVYKNRITGLLDFYIHGMDETRQRGHIHVIGGGGSASGVIRKLFEDGYKVSAGVFFPGDSDLQCAEVFGIERVVGKPFSEIGEEEMQQNLLKIREADAVILCSMPFGLQNLRNLEAADQAGKLIIIEDDSPGSRDFTGGKALELYDRLREKSVLTTTATLHEVLER